MWRNAFIATYHALARGGVDYRFFIIVRWDSTLVNFTFGLRPTLLAVMMHRRGAVRLGYEDCWRCQYLADLT